MRSMLLLILVTTIGAADILRLEALPDPVREPLGVIHAGDGSGRRFVIERAGLLRQLGGGVVLDVQARVHTGQGYQEEGFLSAAFHPHFPKDDRVFAWYSDESPKRMVLAQYHWRAGTAQADAASERRLLEVPWQNPNHKGGTVLFGPDGMLYLSLGDGGGGGDPLHAGQDLAQLNAKILRLDVDHQDADHGYTVPTDNPFVATAGARGEIWAYGLRNVWRMAFAADGQLWAGDVGQNSREEIDLIVRGGNYGWNRREGHAAFQDGAAQAGDVEPLYDYLTNDGKSVIGGHVCRSPSLPALRGVYIFGDFVSGRIWGLRRVDGQVRVVELLQSKLAIASFGEDEAGELYLCNLKGGVYRVLPAAR
jgi:glucose/arabinose dehydrogenase